MSDVALSTVFANQRRKVVTFTSSNASYPIPKWAKGGIMYVTGCGSGAGGAATTNAGMSAACAIRHPIMIPSSASTLSVTIAAGGSAGGGPGNGNPTDIAIDGANILRLNGGSSTNYAHFWDGSAWVAQSFTGATYNDTRIVELSGMTLIKGRANLSSTPGSGPFGAATTTSVAGYGIGGIVNGAGKPGFLIVEFVEGV